jgi:hypothetical protein
LGEVNRSEPVDGLELDNQAPLNLVDTFEEAGAEHTMYLPCRPQHRRRDLVDLSSWLLQLPGVPGVLAVHSSLSVDPLETLPSQSC